MASCDSQKIHIGVKHRGRHAFLSKTSSSFNLFMDKGDTIDHNLPLSNEIIIDTLDKTFCENEIIETISQLNRNKSSGCDNISPDFFIDAKEFIAPFLVKIFNKIFETGTYPEMWTKGIIVPIFKKGDKSNPANYRGITLINSMAKIFSLCLRNRLNKWCEEGEIFNENQYGFRDKRSTVDCIFILHTIIQNILSKNKKLYCAFIDYKSCFDTISIDNLWIKLVQSGISCKFLNVLKSLYAKVSACVRVAKDGKLSDFFDIMLGLQQGEPLSPILFILFVNDINESVDFNNLTNTDLELLSHYMLLFADDIAIFTTDNKVYKRR